MEDKEKKEAIGIVEGVLDELIKKTEKIASSASATLEARITFLRGVALGLFYGIIGNIFVSHYYQVFEGLALGKFDIVFRSNVMLFSVSLVLIIIVSIVFYYRMKKYEKGKRELSEVLTELEEMQLSKMEERVTKMVLEVLAKKKSSE